MKRYLIGLDIGTSSTKAILVDDAGQIVKSVAPAYPFQTPKPLWAESDPEDWWRATQTAIAELLGKDIAPEAVAGVGLSGQMHGLVLLDAEGKVLRPCIMWNDQRTAAECAELTERVGARRVLEITGNPVLPGFTAPKIEWVRKNEPEVWARVRHILLPKDFIRYRLSGVFGTDVSDASGMSLLDVGARRWSPEMAEACGVKLEMLAEVAESAEVTAHVHAAGAAATGLAEGTPIVAGGGDQAAGAIGCGIVSAGRVSCTLGTSGVLFAHAEEFRPDPEGRLHAFCSAVPGKWHFMGVQLSCAGAYQWFRDQLAPGEPFEKLNEGAVAVPPGADGLLFLPYLTGERTPHPDPLARAVFCGLTLRHNRSHMTRAVMEGVTFGLRDALEIMRDLGLQPTEIIAAGGGAKSPLWRQILADTFATPIVTVNATEGAAYGAAILAAVGAGLQKDVESACENWIAQTSRTEPDPATSTLYDKVYPIYAALYPALKPTFEKLGELPG